MDYKLELVNNFTMDSLPDPELAEFVAAEKQRELNKALIDDNHDLRLQLHEARKQLASVSTGSCNPNEQTTSDSNTANEEEKGVVDDVNSKQTRGFWKIDLETDDDGTTNGSEQAKSGTRGVSARAQSHVAPTGPLLRPLSTVIHWMFSSDGTGSESTAEGSFRTSSGTSIMTDLDDALPSETSAEPVGGNDGGQNPGVLELCKSAAVFIFLLTTLQTYVACRRERSRWLEANNLSRSYLFSMLHYNASLLVAPGANPDLSLGIQTIPQVWKVLKHTAAGYACDLLVSAVDANTAIVKIIRQIVF